MFDDIYISVAQLCNLYIEETELMSIWDTEAERTVFKGSFRDAMKSEYAENTVCSYGIEGGLICINISC